MKVGVNDIVPLRIFEMADGFRPSRFASAASVLSSYAFIRWSITGCAGFMIRRGYLGHQQAAALPVSAVAAEVPHHQQASSKCLP